VPFAAPVNQGERATAASRSTFLTSPVAQPAAVQIFPWTCAATPGATTKTPLTVRLQPGSLSRFTIWWKMPHQGFFFSKVVEAGFHEESIGLVATAKIDGSAIDSQVLPLAMRDDPTPRNPPYRRKGTQGHPTTSSPWPYQRHTPSCEHRQIPRGLTSMPRSRSAGNGDVGPGSGALCWSIVLTTSAICSRPASHAGFMAIR